MSIIEKLKDEDIIPLVAAIDKMQSMLARCPNLRASQILTAKERHAISTLALAVDNDSKGQRIREVLSQG